MIDRITVKDNKRTPFRYIPELESFGNGTEYVFRPGLNIIVGENGCGKTTLMNVMRGFLLCDKTHVSTLPDNAYSFPHLWNEGGNMFLDGIDILCDYRGVAFNMINANDLSNEDSLRSIANFGLTFSKFNSSTGEAVMDSLGAAVKAMTECKKPNFPIKELTEMKERANGVWRERIEQLLEYYERNRIKDISKENFEFTLLLDEPDRNLDIDNLSSIYNILTYDRPHTQVVVVIHNPLLIYKLSKCKNVNFVEMTKDYVKKVISFVDKK